MGGPYNETLKESFASVHTNLVYYHARDFGRWLVLCAEAVEELQQLKGLCYGGVTKEVPGLLAGAQPAVNKLLGEWITLQRTRLTVIGTTPLLREDSFRDLVVKLSPICYDPDGELREGRFGRLADSLRELQISYDRVLKQMERYRMAQKNEKFDFENLPHEGQHLWGTTVGMIGDGQHSSGFFTYKNELDRDGTINITHAQDDVVQYSLRSASLPRVAPSNRDQPSRADRDIEETAYLNMLRHLRSVANGMQSPSTPMGEDTSQRQLDWESRLEPSGSLLAFSTDTTDSKTPPFTSLLPERPPLNRAPSLPKSATAGQTVTVQVPLAG